MVRSAFANTIATSSWALYRTRHLGLSRLATMIRMTTTTTMMMAIRTTTPQLQAFMVRDRHCKRLLPLTQYVSLRQIDPIGAE